MRHNPMSIINHAVLPDTPDETAKLTENRNTRIFLIHKTINQPTCPLPAVNAKLNPSTPIPTNAKTITHPFRCVMHRASSNS
jgi:hypothetical protein